jgi:hypothetical protein
MALTFDTKAQGISNSNPVVLSYTCGANAKVLVVGLAIQDEMQEGGWGTPTYNGIAMTQAAVTRQAVSEVTVEMWYLINPPTGAAYNISVPNDPGYYIRIIASSYNSDLNVALDVTGGWVGSTANPSKSVTTTVDGDAVVDIMANSYNSAETERNQTLLYATDEGTWNSAAQYALQATAGLITFSHTIAAADWGLIIAAFKEVSAAEPTIFIPWIDEDLMY